MDITFLTKIKLNNIRTVYVIMLNIPAKLIFNAQFVK